MSSPFEPSAASGWPVSGRSQLPRDLHARTREKRTAPRNLL